MFALKLLFWAVILQAIVSTLISFNVLDTRNRFVWSVADFLTRITDPLLRPIRRRMPDTGNVDFSPLILLVGIGAVAMPIVDYIYAGIRDGVWPRLF
jgi:YggT family protein